MNILLLITSSEEIIKGFKTALPSEYIVLTADSLEKGSELVQTEQIKMVAVDSADPDKTGLWLKKYKAIPDVLWIGIVSSTLSENKLDRFYEMFDEIVFSPVSHDRLSAVIKKAEEKHEIMSEIRHLKLLSAAHQYTYAERGEASQLSFEFLEKAVAMSKMFTANFDLDRLINLFLDAVTDVIGSSRTSLILFDDQDKVYRIKGARGLRPELISGLRLSPESGIVMWLSAKGRILRRDKIDAGNGYGNILSRALREMEVLQSLISIPIMYKGALLCILNLDSKITGEPYTNAEVERIFTLANYFGGAIQDIYSYQRVCYQKDYIHKILERMESGVITVNERQEIIMLNPKAEEILQVRASEVIGKASGLLPPAIDSLIKETILERKTRRKHEIISREDGLCLEVDTYGLYDSAGTLIGGVVLFEDISAKKELSLERKKGENLQVLNELIGRMAHELRNPMVAVRTFTQLMKDRYNDAEFQNFFYNTVTGEVEKLNNLIEKLIAFAHPIEYKFDVVDLGEILDKSLESVLKGLMKDFHIIKNYTPGIFKLHADKIQLSRAFSYLFQNSVTAMASGGSLTVDVESLSRDSVIRVSIKDTGKGIPKEDIDMVFDPFYTTPEKGIGLGLPLSQKIIEDHKGKMTISSILNEGTTLMVLLPIAAST